MTCTTMAPLMTSFMTIPTLQTVMEELERSGPTTPCSPSSSSSAPSSPCKGWTRSLSRILRPSFLQLGNPQIASYGRTTSRHRRRRHSPSRSSSPVFRLFKSIKVRWQRNIAKVSLVSRYTNKELEELEETRNVDVKLTSTSTSEGNRKNAADTWSTIGWARYQQQLIITNIIPIIMPTSQSLFAV